MIVVTSEMKVLVVAFKLIQKYRMLMVLECVTIDKITRNKENKFVVYSNLTRFPCKLRIADYCKSRN